MKSSSTSVEWKREQHSVRTKGNWKCNDKVYEIYQVTLSRQDGGLHPRHHGHTFDPIYVSLNAEVDRSKILPWRLELVTWWLMILSIIEARGIRGKIILLHQNGFFDVGQSRLILLDLNGKSTSDFTTLHQQPTTIRMYYLPLAATLRYID